MLPLLLLLTGDLTGTVTWAGPPADAPAFRASRPRDGRMAWVEAANPHLPRVDPATGGVADAVVEITGVPRESHQPWPHGPLEVVAAGRQLRVHQDNVESGWGFARPGDVLKAVSRQPELEGVRARGAAFFTLMLPGDGATGERVLREAGDVAISSGAANFWASATVLVRDHPYLARTDAQGRFRIAGVPPGEYRAVVRLADWRVASRETDPELGWVVRQTYRPPITRELTVTVRPGEPAALAVTLGAGPPRSPR